MITLFSQPGCHQCKMIHMLLDKKHMEYIEIQDIEQMKEQGITKTPTLVVDGIKLVGQQMGDFINLGKLPEVDSCTSCEVK